MKEAQTDTLENPRKEYYRGEYPEQHQEAPGIEGKMDPVPDTGEKSYRGYGRLKGRKALITGGDSGIGRAVAIACSREGADIAVNYLDVEQPDANSLKKLIEEENGKIALVPGDVSREENCREIVRQALERLGGLDILVLNAGTQTAVKSIEDLPTEQLVHTFATNVFSMYWIVKEALPRLPAGAAIITTASIEAFQPNPFLLDYAATKSAIVGFTRALSKQLAKKGIRVNAVAPGPVWTALQVTGGQFPENIPSFGKDTPLGRAGQPAELAPVYVFLASGEASYITGQIVGVTGGELL